MTPALRLRPAALGDVDLLLRWRNEASTRAQFFHPDEVDRETHEAWLARTLASPATRLFVLEADGVPVGQARVDAESGLGEISVSLDPTARGRGLGRALIREATLRAAAELALGAVHARIKADNEASRRAFASAGYSEEVGRDHDIVLLRWSAPP